MGRQIAEKAYKYEGLSSLILTAEHAEDAERGVSHSLDNSDLLRALCALKRSGRLMITHEKFLASIILPARYELTKVRLQ
jgi:hypothetical protein